MPGEIDSTPSEILVAVDSGYFYAGLILTDGIVTRAAPILKYTLGWDRARASAYFKARGWRAFIVPAVTP